MVAQRSKTLFTAWKLNLIAFFISVILWFFFELIYALILINIRVSWTHEYLFSLVYRLLGGGGGAKGRDEVNYSPHSKRIRPTADLSRAKCPHDQNIFPTCVCVCRCTIIKLISHILIHVELLFLSVHFQVDVSACCSYALKICIYDN